MKNLCRRVACLACMAITVIVVAGCGSDSKPDSGFAELEDQLGFSQSGIVERQSRVEGEIRDCMKAQGFDYIPVDPFAQRAALTGKARMSDEEFTKQFGYGITTLFGRGSEQSDPNDRIRKSLGPADKAAYDRALFGDTPGLTFAEAADTDATSELGGCTRHATDQVFGGTAVLSSLQKKLDALDEKVLEDQRMVRAIEKWSTCMAEEGYRYSDPEDIDGDLLKRFEAIVGTGVRPGATEPPDPSTTYDHAALADLQREEVKISSADVKCEKKEITPVETVVRPQYESEFRQQNKQLLSRVKPLGG
jgi:hypothetical protein